MVPPRVAAMPDAEQDPPVRSKIQWVKILGERLGNEGLKLGDLAPHMGDEVQLCQLLVELGCRLAASMGSALLGRMPSGVCHTSGERIPSRLFKCGENLET